MHKKTITAFRNSNKEAFKSIFNMLYPAMCSFARKFITNYNDAEDIAQEVFIELWNQRAKFESFDQIKAFLYLSVKNRCINFNKHITVKEKYASMAHEEFESYFEEIIIETEIVNNLKNAIKSLPEQQKQVIFLSLKGLTNEEIAQNMEISINTVKLYKKIAYQQLRTKIGTSLLLLFFA